MIQLIGEELKRYTVAVVAAKRHGKSTSVKTILSRLQGFHFKVFDVCYDNETEILTLEGWKLFKDLKNDEFVATLNKNDEIEYQKIIRKIEKKSHQLLLYKGLAINFCVTPQHRFLIYKRYRRQRTGKDIIKKEIFTANELFTAGSGNRYYIPRTGKWIGKKTDWFVLPKYIKKWPNSRRTLYKDEKWIPMNDWLLFFGLFLSEGCTPGKTTAGTPSTVAIDQHAHSENVDKIRTCLNNLKFNFKEYEYVGSGYGTPMIRFQIHDVQLALPLSKIGKSKNKYIPRWILKLPPKQLKILFEGMMIGDGSRTKYRDCYSTSSKRLADDFQELLFKIGKLGNINKKSKAGNYRIQICRRERSMIIKKNFKLINDNRKVYCVQVPNQVIYVRRKGQPMWSMNSQSWYHVAPLRWRQRIHRGKTTEFKNIPDCVYEIGNLDEDTRREVVAQIIREDYDSRYFGKLIEGPQVIDQVPWICYVFEECETFFDSRSLNKKDRCAEVFRDFIKVGSNYGLTGLMVVQVMHGELATKIRRRSGLLLGQIQGSAEIREIRNRTNRETAEIVKKIDRFNWVYWNGVLSERFRIPDVVTSVPEDYRGSLVEVQNR